MLQKSKDGVPAVKEFNTTGLCNPNRHYMVDISERLKAIKAMVDNEKYFCINRARQYGKTTTIKALVNYLQDDYLVIALDFQNIDSAVYDNSGSFTQGLARLFMDAHEFAGADIPENILKDFGAINQESVDLIRLDEIFRLFRRWCRESEKKIVLMIDEVDTASNNQVFLDFFYFIDIFIQAIYFKYFFLQLIHISAFKQPTCFSIFNKFRYTSCVRSQHRYMPFLTLHNRKWAIFITL